MDPAKTKALAAVDEKSALICEVNDKIWEYAELSLLEQRSAELYCRLLREEGFEVETPIAGMTTAFTGRYGHGRPILGILAEYDALAALNQKAGIAERCPREPEMLGLPGHGCHHHALGAGSFGAALAVKAYLEENPQVSGTVILYGTPGEEGGAGKTFMARDGVFNDIDAALTWHPGCANEVVTGSNNACIQVEYGFSGVAAHAAGVPHLGRSALDAVEMMNIGVQFLREHMPDAARIHYAITDPGGYSPNVVQPNARVLYMVRSPQVREAIELLKRVDAIAAGAAKMTGTVMRKRYIDGTANTIPNRVLEEMMFENFTELGVPSYTEEEKAYASSLIAAYENRNPLPPGFAAQHNAAIGEQVKAIIADGRPLADFLMPLFHSNDCSPGSTDVGDVSWHCPTVQIHAVTQPINSPGHSWQNVAVGCSSIAHKGVLTAAKVIAAGAIDLFNRPDILEKAKDEWRKTLGGESYLCPIPKDVPPTPVGDDF